MTDDELRKLAEAALKDDKAATPGPWDHVLGGVNHRSTVAAEVVDAGGRQVLRTLEGCIDDGGIGAVTMTRGKYEREAANARLIAAARIREPELARAVLRLLEERDAWKERAVTWLDNATRYTR